jgi:hypothetical protein
MRHRRVARIPNGSDGLARSNSLTFTDWYASLTQVSVKRHPRFAFDENVVSGKRPVIATFRHPREQSASDQLPEKADAMSVRPSIADGNYAPRERGVDRLIPAEESRCGHASDQLPHYAVRLETRAPSVEACEIVRVTLPEVVCSVTRYPLGRCVDRSPLPAEWEVDN